jgi:hypothetical protein
MWNNCSGIRKNILILRMSWEVVKLIVKLKQLILKIIF